MSIDPHDPPLDPIRAELFSIERLEQHAESLAASQNITRKPTAGPSVLQRVKENQRVLTLNYRNLSRAIRDKSPITPAAAWLVDNFYIVEDQVREILQDLPPGFYKKLPKLTDGHLCGYPRIYSLAWAFVAHTDSRLDPEWLKRFVRAYQKSDTLQIGELWALAISLRIVLIENLRRLTERMTASRTARQQADAVADSLLGLKGQTARSLDDILHRFDDTPLKRPFAVQLVQRLRDQEGDAADVLRWLDQRLAGQSTTADEIVQVEHQSQTASNTTVRNIITGMKLLSVMDWATFVEDVSHVDEILRAGSDFGRMDFATRDRYRHAIEELSRGSGLYEVDVARRVLSFAHRASTPMHRDPGYFLISGGRDSFEIHLGFRVSLSRKIRRTMLLYATPAYLGLLTAMMLVILVIPLTASAELGLPLIGLIAFGILGLFPASDLAMAIVNSLVSDTVVPKRLPKLDFKAGVPQTHPTLVVIPAMLSSVSVLHDLLQQIEIHYLSNSEGHLQFALLTDWPDAAQAVLPEDEAVLTEAREGIRTLNQRYASTDDRFFIFHRRRLWNEQEGVWMGWERKRGKLRELNRLLRGDAQTSYLEATSVPSAIRYVITLDADSHIPRGAAHAMVGAMAHPLNAGYGVMQPRITPTLPRAGFGSHFQHLYSGPAGVDPYAFAVSDVYQDLFKEGSFTGKGIYDIDAFEAAIDDRMPENRVLSHDLLEGIYAKTALLTDVELFEEFPSHYEVATARNHRWVRGDWQLLAWLTDRSISLIGRWKLFDNLRRSLSMPAAFLLIVGSWLFPHPATRLWMLFVGTTIVIPPLISAFIKLLPRGRTVSMGNHLRGLRFDIQLGLTHSVLTLLFMPHQAWMMMDAIVRTLVRLTISHKRMLEWQTAALSRDRFNLKVSAFYARMKSVPLMTLVLVVGVHVWRPSAWDWSLSLLAGLWLISPWVAQRLSLPLDDQDAKPLIPAEQVFLRRMARKTWRFFETFVDANQNFLPPDNFQEIPLPVVAHRSSPTNIGLYLLSIISARQLGWIGRLDALERIEATLTTVLALPRHRGHLFNWYDTQTLRPLEPLYISTVDSGNLAGHLWTLAQACRVLAKPPGDNRAFIPGLQDVFALIKEATPPPSTRSPHLPIPQALSAIEQSLQDSDSSPRWLSEISQNATQLIDHARAAANAELLFWSERLLEQIKSHNRDQPKDDGTTRSPQDRWESIARQCEKAVEDMEFGFLWDPVKKIFSIGYLPTEQKLDISTYDLLASEARLASFIAIAKGDVPALHWFHLSRAVTRVDRGTTLLSWSGSMFEYLMPALIMRHPAGSLLDQSCRRAVRRQREYGRERHVPWGISESGYNVQDMEFTYQYSSFGVPGLGLKRGLSEDLLIAPYATALAALLDPAASIRNFQHLTRVGAEGSFGFYEALDYTPERLPEGLDVSIVREYMAHHQGMTLVALTNVLEGGVFQTYFHTLPKVRASELLLQERLSRDLPPVRIQMKDAELAVRLLPPPILRRFQSPHGKIPQTHLLSNGRYSVMITAAGAGYSRWHNQDVTRWREDVTRDDWGSFIYLRDVHHGLSWSAGYQPARVDAEQYEVDFSESRAEIIRRDGFLETTLDVVVSPEDDAEIRRVSIKNSGPQTRELEVTSYAELVLAPHAADQAHPAFSNLFVQTEFVASVCGLIGTRRTRSPEDAPLWAAHVVASEGDTHQSDLEYESDRLRFIGRGQNVHSPAAMQTGAELSMTAGAVLDPVVSLRRRIRIASGKTVRLSFTTLVAPSREKVLGLADKYHDPAMYERTVMLAWTQAHIQLHHLGIEPGEAHLFQNLASRILYSESGLRASPVLLEKNRRGAPGLWAHSISGDFPIVLVRIDETDDRDIVRQLLRAHEYWRLKNLIVDLVILNEKTVSYIQELQTSLEALVRTNPETSHIFVLRSDRLSSEDRLLLLAAARIILLSRHGSLAEQLERLDDH